MLLYIAINDYIPSVETTAQRHGQQSACNPCHFDTTLLFNKFHPHLCHYFTELHPDNFSKDLKKALLDQQQLFVKVSPATNASKLLDSCVAFLLEVYDSAEKVEDQPDYKGTVTKHVLSVVSKWITSDSEVGVTHRC